MSECKHKMGEVGDSVVKGVLSPAGFYSLHFLPSQTVKLIYYIFTSLVAGQSHIQLDALCS